MERPVVILYGFGAGDLKKLRTLCARMGLRPRQVRPEETGQKVGAFAGETAFAENAGPEEIAGQMLVLAGLTDRQIEVFLSGMRTARVGRSALKAVLTPTNSGWTGAQLYAELKKEREAMGDKPIHPGQEET